MSALTGRPGRKPLALGAAALALLLVGSGAFYFSGGYDKWQDSKALDRVCGGIVPQGELRELLDWDGRLTADEPWTRTARGDRGCVIESPELGTFPYQVDVSLKRGESSHELLKDAVYLPDDSKYYVAPIGNGWRGVLNLDVPQPKATVVMPCRSDGGDALVVGVKIFKSHSKQWGADDRVRFARFATQTAGNAAEQAGCGATPGKTVRELPGGFIDRNGPVDPPGRATGTCAGIEAPTRETAADALAPIENCVVAGPKGVGAYRLSAFYGPFVQDGYTHTGIGDAESFAKARSGSDGDLHWTSAKCPAQGGPAFFTAHRIMGGDRGPLPPDALRTFAARSAKAHGCEAPEEIPRDRD